MANIEDTNNILAGLSDKEREVALLVLKEISEKGESDTLNHFIYDDYKEIPVDIDTFIDDPRYLRNAWYTAGGECKLYPFWREQLHKIFPTNIDTAVNNLIESGARGLGKSEIAVLIASYLMYRLICLKNPLEHYFMKPTEKFCFAFMNIKLDDAEDIANHKFQNTVRYSPWFLEHGTLTGRNKDFWEPPEFIQIIVGSQSSDIIGKPIFYSMFDEISFIRNQDIDKQKEKAKDMMNTAIGGMKTRFIHGGRNPTLLILASSKRSDKSFLEEHMKKSLEADGENVLIVDKSVWEIKPQGTYSKQTFNVAVGNKYHASKIISDEEIEAYRRQGYKLIFPPIDFLPDFRKDMDRALCDFAGISSSELSKYISGEAVQDTVNYSIKNPFVQEILEIGNDIEDKAQYYHFFNMEFIPKDMIDKPLYIHLDMSISGDMTGIAGVWIKGKKPSTDALKQANDLFYRVAFAVNIKAPKGRQIAFEKNRNFIYWLKEQGFNIKGISTDSFQAYDTGQALTAKGYNYKMISVDKVDSNHICIPYQYYKNTIYEGRVEVFPCKTLEDELTDLERNINTGKVDHPEGGKKDIADAVCGAIFNASSYAEQFAYDYGENLSLALDVNNNDDPTTSRQQLTLSMEEELKLMNRQGVLNQASTAQQSSSQPQSPTGVGPTDSKMVDWKKPNNDNGWFII